MSAMRLYYKDFNICTMDKYPQMISLLAKHYPWEVSQLQQEIGRHCLKTLFYHTILLHSIKLDTKFIIQHLEDILVHEFKLNHEQVLLMVVANKVWRDQCAKSKGVIIDSLKRIILEYNQPGKEEQFKRNKKKKKYNHQCADDSFWDTQSQDQAQDHQIIEQLMSQLSQKTQGQFIQNYVPIILTKQNPAQIPFNQQILIYISSLTSPKTQLSVFCQKFKLNYPEYKRNKNNDIYIIKGQLRIDCYFTGFVGKLYSAQSRFANLKRAQNQVALELLQKIWIDYPEVWREYIKMRNEKK